MHIHRTIIDAILCDRTRLGMRLGGQELANLLNVSRTIVSQSPTRLEARALVQVTARRRWFIAEPSVEEAAAALQPRRSIESGILNDLTARSLLFDAPYQTTPDAARSCDDHAHTVNRLEAGDYREAARVMITHISAVETHLTAYIKHARSSISRRHSRCAPRKPDAIRPPRRRTASAYRTTSVQLRK